MPIPVAHPTLRTCSAAAQSPTIRLLELLLWSLLVLLTASSCDRQAVTAPTDATPKPSKVYLYVDKTTSVDVMTPVSANLVDLLSTPPRSLSGIRVVFHALTTPADSIVAFSNRFGTANFSWRAPQLAGVYLLVVQTGHIADTVPVRVLPGPIVRVEVQRDSIRFTRMAQSVKRPIRLFDRFDNLSPAKLEGFVVTTTGPFSASVSDDTLTIGSSSYYTPFAGALVIQGSVAGNELARIRLLFDPVIASVGLIGGLDSIAGIGVHESTTVRVVARDSGVQEIPIPNVAAFIGVQFASSAPAVASVSASGVVVGLKPGTTLITARYGSSSYSATLPVVQSFDYGALRTIYANYFYDGYTQYDVPVTDDAGNSLLATNHRPHHSNGETIISWHHPDGVTRWTRTVGYPGYAIFKSGSEVYVADPDNTIALDAAGTTQWVQPVGGLPVLFQNGVLVLRDSIVSAVSTAGTLLWSRSYPGTTFPRTAIGAGDRIYVRTQSPNGHSITLALGLDGIAIWSRTDAGLLDADDVRVYAKTSDAITAFDRFGQVVWTTPMSGSAVGVRGPDATLIVQSYTELRLVDRGTGRTLWSQPLDLFYQRALPLVIGRNVVTFNAYMRTWNASTGELLGRNAIAGLWARCTSLGLFVSDDIRLQRFDHC